jgi:hypothetical protein
VVAADAPTLANCGFDTDKWTQAMHAWTQVQIQSGIKQAIGSEREAATMQEIKVAFEERLAAFEKTTPDIKVVLGNPALPRLSREAGKIVMQSDLGVQILYHLGKNPDKASRIARQDPIQQAAAVGRLEAELRAPAKARQSTNAPPPPTPNRGASAPPLDDANMSMKEYVAKERQAMIARRSRAAARN